jgi:hypothetical protein
MLLDMYHPSIQDHLTVKERLNLHYFSAKMYQILKATSEIFPIHREKGLNDVLAVNMQARRSQGGICLTQKCIR